MIVKKIPVCMIGAGRIGLKLEFDPKRMKPASHYGMWARNKKFDLKAISDKKKIERKYSKKINKNVVFYKNFEKMIIEQKPKIVSISTWKDTHYMITKRCIEMGLKVIILEKPLANNIKEAKKLINIINKKKAKVLVNHRRRYDDDIISLKNKLKTGIIGDIIQVSSFYVYGLLTTGTHLIDTLRMLLSEIYGDVETVVGFENVMNNFRPKDDKNYDAIIRFKKGLVATMQSLDMKSYDNFDINIFGKKGKILISGIGRDILYYKVDKSPEHSGFTELSSNFKRLNKSRPRPQFKKLSTNAYNCLLNGSKPLCSAYDSYKDMIIINKIIQSSKKGSKKLKIKF